MQRDRKGVGLGRRLVKKKPSAPGKEERTGKKKRVKGGKSNLIGTGQDFTGVRLGIARIYVLKRSKGLRARGDGPAIRH